MTRLVLIAWLAAVGLPGSAFADEWMVGLEPSNHWCRVERKVPVPRLDYISGPFATQKLACTDAKNKFDDTATQSRRCSSYFVEAASECKTLGVTLPR